MADFEKIADGVIAGDFNGVARLTGEAISKGAKPLEIINGGLIKGMNVVGARFRAGDMFVPEVMMSARAMKEGMELVKPLIAESDLPTAGKVVLGTVIGDLHDIGKNLVGMMMESAGMNVVNLGVDVPPEKFVQAVREHNPEVVALSALLTTTMPAMKDTIDALMENGLKDSVKVIVGGAPVTQDFADEIGADGWASDAASAKDLALEMVDQLKL
ncbi:MAG TPA: cobalamin-binding protein [Firmicutes bacterium]|nr:cobalamin-binding protein [Bacillota bacterium]